MLGKSQGCFRIVLFPQGIGDGDKNTKSLAADTGIKSDKSRPQTGGCGIKYGGTTAFCHRAGLNHTGTVYADFQSTGSFRPGTSRLSGIALAFFYFRDQTGQDLVS